jgi:glycosyltransferase involved in cell wall biosynthesis
LIENLLAILTNTFIAVSEGEKKQASKIFPFAKKKIVLVQNGVNIPETISQKKHDNNSIIICCIARLDYQKNLELLIPITKKLLISTKKKVTINVIGVGNNDNELKNLIDKEKLTDTINLRGFTKDTSFWLNDAHLFLSTSRWEGMPLSILEASAHGLPVVASDVIGNKDAVTNEVTGYLYPVEQPEKAAAFVLEILNDKNLYEQMSKKGKENVQKNFSLKVMAQKTEHLYLSLAK